MHSVILSTTFLRNHVTDHPKTACQPFCNVTMFNQHIHSVPFINTQETKLCRPHLQFTKRTEMFQGVLPLNLWCQPIVLKCSSPVYRYLREDEFQCQCTGCPKKKYLSSFLSFWLWKGYLYGYELISNKTNRSNRCDRTST